MKSWTSIPFYLWKNTYRRWLEYPISPLSKILVPLLLSFLAIIVLSMFADIERDLKEQLAKSPAYTVVVEEFVAKDMAPTVLHQAIAEELMWSNRYGDDVLNSIRRPMVSALWRGRQRVPIFVFLKAPEVQVVDGVRQQMPVPIFWSDVAARHGQVEHLQLQTMNLSAMAEPIPEWLIRDLAVKEALAVPAEMAVPLLQNGFMNIMVVRFGEMADIEQFVLEVGAYYKAEGRNVKITSALELLQNLERISGIQRVVRSLIVFGCGLILTLTLGSVAWLEYRQDAYLLALLKSFGTPSLSLLVHMLLENLILVFIGLAITWVMWPVVYQLALPQLEAVGLQVTGRPAITIMDHATIALAALLGCFLAMVPIAFGLRKPAGLTLQ